MRYRPGMTKYENTRVRPRRLRRLAAAQPPRAAQLVHDRDVARAARARRGAARRSGVAGADRRSATAARSRRASTRRVHRSGRRVRSRTVTTRDASRRSDSRRHPAHARGVLVAGRPRRYPTIAAVRGYALGAGLQLALACDIRVFARGTSVGLLEHKYGILPDLGGTQRLPRVVGAGKAKEMIWTAARIDADEAYRIGLCERLVDDDAARARRSARSPRRSPRNRRSRCRAPSARSKRRCACRSPKGWSWKPRARRSACVPTTCGKAIAAFVEQRESALLRQIDFCAMTRFRVRPSGPLEGRRPARRARPRTPA